MEDVSGGKTLNTRGFVPVPKDKKYVGFVAGLEAALWTSPAEALAWGQQMCEEAGKMIELVTEHRMRVYKNGEIIKETTL